MPPYRLNMKVKNTIFWQLWSHWSPRLLFAHVLAPGGALRYFKKPHPSFLQQLCYLVRIQNVRGARTATVAVAGD